jgi:hypothetical protein
VEQVDEVEKWKRRLADLDACAASDALDRLALPARSPASLVRRRHGGFAAV